METGRADNRDLLKSGVSFWLRHRCAFGLCVLLCYFPKAEAGDFFLRDGDRVVFLGDSITEQRLYTTFIEAYALTRHPQWRLSFRNAGWSGDTAFFRSRCHTDGGALLGADEAARQKMIDDTIARGLGRDVLALKPTVVTIDFGMNDISVRPATNLYATYLGCLTKMATLLQGSGARVAFLTPQPVEEKVANLKEVEKNQSLRKFSDGIREVATKTGMDFVDQFDPYMAVLQRERVGNPDVFLGGGNDPVHPGAVGHTIMAWAILKGLGATPLVSRAQIDAKSQNVVAAEACRIENLKISDGTISFDRTDDALPLPIHPKAEAALKLVPVLEDLNRYDLQITGLEPGNYQLSIDGEPVEKLSAQQLAKGWNLASNAGPITRQAQEVLKEISNKNDLYFKRWRSVQLAPIPDWAQSPEVESRRTEEMAKLDAQIAESEGKLDKLRQPAPHHFEVSTPVAP